MSRAQMLQVGLTIITAALWAASGWCWLASARASQRARTHLRQAPVMAPGRPAVSTDWLATFQRTQMPVARYNSWAAWLAAAAGAVGFVLAIVPIFGLWAAAALK